MSSLDWTSHAAELFRQRGEIEGNPIESTTRKRDRNRLDSTSLIFQNIYKYSRSSRVLFGQKIDRSQPLTANPDLLKNVFLQNQRDALKTQ